MILGTLSKLPENFNQNFLEATPEQIEMAEANISQIFNPKQTIIVKSQSDKILEEIYGE